MSFYILNRVSWVEKNNICFLNNIVNLSIDYYLKYFTYKISFKKWINQFFLVKIIKYYFINIFNLDYMIGRCIISDNKIMI